MYDVAVIGGGPGGATCAALCAAAGRRVLVLERSRFPREKVCGDCLNPLAWNVLERLGVIGSILNEPHKKLEGVRFVGVDGRSVRISLPPSDKPELGITRSRLDAVLLRNARNSGAEIIEGSPLTHITRTAAHWQIKSDSGCFNARQLVAADGRNSSVCRILGLLTAFHSDDRVGTQIHFNAPAELGADVALHFLPQGYMGLAPVGDGQANLCLVTRANQLNHLKKRAIREYGIARDQQWRSISPLSRTPLPAAQENLWLVGDAARVVEPFTGEGIAYALCSGVLCAEALLEQNPNRYILEHKALYRGRIWINQLAKAACLFPRMGTALVAGGQIFPEIFTLLTRKVVKS